MYSLFLDHSFPNKIVALFKDKLVLEERDLSVDLSSSPCRAFEEMLIKAGETFDKVSCLVCGNGPGSYTGMRAAASTMKALGFARDLPLIAVPSLLLLSPSEDGEFLAILDARIAGFYGERITICNGEIEYESPCILSEEVLASRNDPKVLVVANPSDLRASLYASKFVGPHSDGIALVAAQKKRLRQWYTAESFPLNYLREAMPASSILPLRPIQN
jgi:tRNA threonylcarbamoyladenosine biosynthesis protein TsaB